MFSTASLLLALVFMLNNGAMMHLEQLSLTYVLIKVV